MGGGDGIGVSLVDQVGILLAGIGRTAFPMDVRSREFMDDKGASPAGRWVVDKEPIRRLLPLFLRDFFDPGGAGVASQAGFPSLRSVRVVSALFCLKCCHFTYHSNANGSDNQRRRDCRWDRSVFHVFVAERCSYNL